MYEAYQAIEVEGLPKDCVTTLIRTLANRPGSVAVERRRPIVVQLASSKWLTGVLLLQLQDALFHLPPTTTEGQFEWPHDV